MKGKTFWYLNCGVILGVLCFISIVFSIVDKNWTAMFAYLTAAVLDAIVVSLFKLSDKQKAIFDEAISAWEDDYDAYMTELDGKNENIRIRDLIIRDLKKELANKDADLALVKASKAVTKSKTKSK